MSLGLSSIDVSDPQGGAENYRLELSWQGSSFVSPVYSSGRVSWRGRVDDRVNILVSGSEVGEETLSGTPTFGENLIFRDIWRAAPASYVRINEMAAVTFR
ncbi:hypothetical protein BH20ACI2_BH20ACI2_03390 [soil metagenome]